jgi:hypothetical protein
MAHLSVDAVRPSWGAWLEVFELLPVCRQSDRKQSDRKQQFDFQPVGRVPLPILANENL